MHPLLFAQRRGGSSAWHSELRVEAGLHISAPRTNPSTHEPARLSPVKRLNQRQSDCNHSPITNNRKTSKGEIKCQIKKIATHNRAIRRSPLLRSRNP